MDNSRIIAAHLEGILKSKARGELNLVPHFIPLNIEALEISLKHILQSIEDAAKQELEEDYPIRPGITISDFRNRIIKFITSKHKNSINLDLKLTPQQLLDSALPAIVYQKGEIVGVLYSGFSSASKGLFSNFLNKELNSFIKDSIYTVDKAINYTKRFNVGHILDPLSTEDREIATSPLLQKIKETLNTVSQLLQGNLGSIPDITSQYITTNRSNLQNLNKQITSVINTLASRSHYGVRVKATLSKEVTELIKLRGGIVVVIQDEFENQYKYGNLVEGLASSTLLNTFVNSNFSKSIVQEVESRIVETIKSGSNLISTGLRIKPLKVKGPATKVKAKVTKNNTKNVSINLPKTSINTVAAQTNLQSLINMSLAQRIKENMGSGNRQDILNLRSGRFAESAKVTRISQSREGMITAFYTYMKNPYQTFEPGFKQGSPGSRNPRLLISKSIRELASQSVANRMRAVLV